jgi:hypothetical protein
MHMEIPDELAGGADELGTDVGHEATAAERALLAAGLLEGGGHAVAGAAAVVGAGRGADAGVVAALGDVERAAEVALDVEDGGDGEAVESAASEVDDFEGLGWVAHEGRSFRGGRCSSCGGCRGRGRTR